MRRFLHRNADSIFPASHTACTPSISLPITRAKMKTLASVALSVAFVGLHLSKTDQVDSFVVSGSVRPFLHKTLSSRGSRSFCRGRTACRGIQCRMMTGATGDEGRPTKGFAQPQESRKTTARGKGKKKLAAEKAAAAADEKAEEQGTGNRQLFMQFTCNQCEGVSQYMINKNAYDDGIVICTCQKCNVRHLIADNLKKMDFPHFGNNIEEYMQSTGSPEEVTKGSAPDLTPEVLEKFDVSVGADGVLTLSPKTDTQST